MAALLNHADRWLGLQRVELTVYADNARAIGLYEKHGFVREGLHRDFAFRDGTFVEALAMARLRGG
jgi:putative acetyltransferase